jgi:hypothetical protein
VSGDSQLIGLFPFGTNEGIESLSKRPLRLPIPFSTLYELKNVLGSIGFTLRQQTIYKKKIEDQVIA